MNLQSPNINSIVIAWDRFGYIDRTVFARCLCGVKDLTLAPWWSEPQSQFIFVTWTLPCHAFTRFVVSVHLMKSDSGKCVEGRPAVQRLCQIWEDGSRNTASVQYGFGVTAMMVMYLSAVRRYRYYWLESSRVSIFESGSLRWPFLLLLFLWIEPAALTVHN